MTDAKKDHSMKRRDIRCKGVQVGVDLTSEKKSKGASVTGEK